MGLPGDVVTITVTAQYSDNQGNSATGGTVTFTASRSLLADTTASVYFVPLPIVATVNGSGELSVVLPVTDQFVVRDPDYSTWSYVVAESVVFGADTFTRKYNIELPSTLGSTADLSVLAAGVASVYHQ